MIREGIYLEEKQGTVGTSGTSKPIVYRNLWATREIRKDTAVLQLLDDKAAPTGLTEEVPLRELEKRFVYKPVKLETWSALKAKLENAAPPKPKAAPKPKAGKKGNAANPSKSWWQT